LSIGAGTDMSNSRPCDWCAKKCEPCVVRTRSRARTCLACQQHHASCMQGSKEGMGRGQTAGRKRKQVAVADIIVLLEGSEEELVVRALVPKRLVAVGLKPVTVSEKSRVVNMPPDQWWDRKLELGPDDHLMSLAQWAVSIEIWQRDQRELQWRVYKLEKEREKLKEWDAMFREYMVEE